MYVRLLKGNEVALSWAPPNLGNLTAYSAGSVCLRRIIKDCHKDELGIE